MEMVDTALAVARAYAATGQEEAESKCDGEGGGYKIYSL